MRDLRGGLIRTTLGCVLAGTVLLTGCSEKQEASTSLPTPAAAPTTEALPPLGPADLPMPDEAREQTADGAQAFSEYYVELYNHALRTLDTTSMRQLSKACETCDALADQVDRVAAAGQEHEGGEVRIRASTPPYLTGDEAQLVFDVAQAPLSITQSGEPVEGQSMPEYSSTGGGGVLQWDETRASWVMTQWNVP
ncbi:DUF6318 family protein [Blastococcus sp. BMG 814]|uniref:DUF6318 family protein n=1 Tax=Blastococcus carthaginiensis TaxID=3050034 RepID=A0ABT9III0_9ACTN|nr:DUF6318 family protein [Blastococcus carthaginiensis]MDP5185388.1 DUF6318 family protein [Blastococcus carthaginiensis]